MKFSGFFCTVKKKIEIKICAIRTAHSVFFFEKIQMNKQKNQTCAIETANARSAVYTKKSKTWLVPASVCMCVTCVCVTCHMRGGGMQAHVCHMRGGGYMCVI